MRSDYPNADLINKVNSDWIDKVLRNPELAGNDAVNAGADGVDDDDDLALQDDFTVTAGLAQREPAPVAARFKGAGYPARRMARAPRHRSLARRLTERVALAIAVLSLVAGLWIALGFQVARNTVSAQETNAAAEVAQEIDTTALRSTEPAWLSPEILYATAIAPALIRRVEAPPLLPRPVR